MATYVASWMCIAACSYGAPHAVLWLVLGVGSNNGQRLDRPAGCLRADNSSVGSMKKSLQNVIESCVCRFLDSVKIF